MLKSINKTIPLATQKILIPQDEFHKIKRFKVTENYIELTFEKLELRTC